MKKLLSGILSIILICNLFTAVYAQQPTPSEPSNDVADAEIVYLPFKNKVVFGYGSPAFPDGIVLKLKYKDGTEKTEAIIRTESGYYAGEEHIFGGVHLGVVSFGKQTETLYINDESVSVKYDYFVIPPLRSAIYKLLDTFFGFLFPIRIF